jgi:hypothetical protein
MVTLQIIALGLVIILYAAHAYSELNQDQRVLSHDF